MFKKGNHMLHRILGYCTVMTLVAVSLAAEDTLVAGVYKGQWSGTGASGDIQLTFHAKGGGGLTPEVGFTLGGQDVKCKIVSFKAEGAKFTMVYEFDAEGNPLQSAIEGTAKGKTIEGTYKTTAGDQAVDAGTFKVAAP
jgi:hypothetical protein